MSTVRPRYQIRITRTRPYAGLGYPNPSATTPCCSYAVGSTSCRSSRLSRARLRAAMLPSEFGVGSGQSRGPIRKRKQSPGAEVMHVSIKLTKDELIVRDLRARRSNLERELSILREMRKTRIKADRTIYEAAQSAHHGTHDQEARPFQKKLAFVNAQLAGSIPLQAEE